MKQSLKTMLPLMSNETLPCDTNKFKAQTSLEFGKFCKVK